MQLASPQASRGRSPFIGRHGERERLEAELRGGAGLITLTGPSGVGKTRLAQQVAGDLLGAFDDQGGVWFCSLAACEDASDLEAAVANTLGIPQQQGDGLSRSLANRGPLLLILDNLDPLAAVGGEVIARWQERCVELQLVVTSLVPLGIPGERVFDLHPLEPDEAVALYLDRAHRAWADRNFSAEETTKVDELVRRLDRLPLAIELAAARVRLLPPRALLAMLERRFDLLRAVPQVQGTAAAPSRRSSSLRSALELTWSHLGPREQLALARAAVFEGGFTAEAADAVIDPGGDGGGGSSDSDPPRGEVLRILEDLHRKSLLCEGADPRRFSLLESVREYAIAELRRMGRWEETIRRHAAFFLGKDHAQPRLSMELRGADSIRWLEQERANLVAIHRRFLEADPSLAARAGLALAPLILNQGDSTSGAELHEATLDAARRSVEPSLILAALETLHTSHFRAGNFDEAKAVMAEQLELARRTGEKGIEALTLSRLALLHMQRGELERSRPPLQRAALLSDELGIPQLEATILFAQGVEAVERVALGEAEALLARSVLLLQRYAQRGSEVHSLHLLGMILANQGRYAEARRALQGTIEACRDISHRFFEALFLSNLAHIDLVSGLLDEAEAACEQSLDTYRDFGNRFREGLVICSLGIISLEREDLDAAADRLSRAEEILRECGAGRMYAELLCFLVALESRGGQLGEARRLLAEIQAYCGSGDERLDPLFAEGAEAFLEIAAARQLQGLDREEAEHRVDRARLGLAAIQCAQTGMVSYLPVLARLLRREIAAWSVELPPSPSRPDRSLLRIGRDHSWFRLPGRQPVHLRNRWVLKRIFAVLVQARLQTPGVPVDPHELFAVVWPGVEAVHGTTTNRLHMALSALRELGLRSLLLTEEAGYLLDPEVPVQAQEEP